MPELIIIRGITGSGKTTLAKAEYPQHAHFEADMFFIKDGEYKFDIKKLGSAHKWCQAQVKDSLDAGMDVVVANTFTRKWEMKPYLEMGHSVKVVVAKGEFPNTHGVPQAVIENMKKRWED